MVNEGERPEGDDYQGMANAPVDHPEETYGPDAGGAEDLEPDPLSDQLSAQLNEALDAFTQRLIPQLGQVMGTPIGYRGPCHLQSLGGGGCARPKGLR